MSVSITDRAIRQITRAALVVAILCIPGRADAIGDPMGACCLFDGSCIVVTGIQCQTQGGTYQGDDATCDDANCAPLGACCIPFDICEVTTIQVCFGELGGVIWVPEQNCDTFPCPPLGACCELDGTCRITAEFSCEISLGTYQGDGVTCQDSNCPQPCPADFDGDGSVGITDLLTLLAAWGTDPGGPPDFDGDGTVGILDLLTLLANWGACP